MRGLVKFAPGVGNVEVRDLPYPKMQGPDWVIIKIAACGLCATDVHVGQDTFNSWPPVVLGHEFSGTVCEVGPEVSMVKIGDRVTAEPKTGSCGKCPACRQGMLQLCPTRRAPGWGVNGGMTEYIALPESLLHKLPDNVPFDVGALCEPLAIAIHEVDERAKVECMDSVVITGSGPIGILCAFVAKSSGASQVIMSGLSRSEAIRFPVAREVGVDVIVNIEHENLLERVNELTNGKGADLIIEASGSGTAIRDLPLLARTGGRISCIGLCPKDEAPFRWNTAMRKMLDVHFNFSSSYTAWDKALLLMAHSRYDISKIITHHEKIEDWERVFNDQVNERSVKAVFEF